MIKGQKPYIFHGNRQYRCHFAGYVDATSNRWLFVLAGAHSTFQKGDKVDFMGIEFTLRTVKSRAVSLVRKHTREKQETCLVAIIE
jgi:hypothetical protein